MENNSKINAIEFITTILGKVGMLPKGEYEETKEYKRLDVVTNNGSSYVCRKTNVGASLNNTEFWMIVAKAPEKGIDYLTDEEKEKFEKEIVEFVENELDNYIDENTIPQINNHVLAKEEEIDSFTLTKKAEIENAKDNCIESIENKTNECIENVNGAIEGFDANVNNKTEEFNTNVQTRTEEFDKYAEQKTNEFNSNATEQVNIFNTNSEKQTTDFNENANTKIEEFNENSTTQTETFEENVVNKTNEFNDNAIQKNTDFDNNVKNQTDTFNNNVIEKIEEFNDNSENKIQEFNNNVDSYNTRIIELEKENTKKNKVIEDLLSELEDKIVEDEGSLTATNCAKAPAILEISGNGYQETREGYNLLDMSKAKGGTNSGITVTINEDGSYNYVGTATEKAINVWLLGGWTSTNTIFILPAGTYVLKDCIITSYDGENRLYFAPDNNPIVLEKDTYITGVRVINANIGTTYNETYYPMIYEGTEEKNFEQYGLMPSIDYPSEIKSCGDNKNINFKIKNKNWMDLSKIQQRSLNGITCVYNAEENSVTFNGTCTTNNTAFLIPNSSIVAQTNQTTLSVYYISGSCSNYLNLALFDNDFYRQLSVPQLYELNETNPMKTSTYHYSDERKLNKWQFRFNEGSILDNFTIKVMLTEYPDTEYQSYLEQNYNIPTQKPMLDGDYFDFKNYKEVHNWSKIESYNNEEITTEYKSTTGELSEGATVYYKLKEPELLPCTEEQIQILEELSNLETYYEVTNIISEDEIKPNLKLTYKLSNKLKQKELEERVNALENLLSTTETNTLDSSFSKQAENIENEDVE